MFEFANFLLLALFAAAAVDLVRGWRAAGSLLPALADLWSRPHLLFSSRAESLRLRAGAAVFCVGLAAYEVSVVFCNSMARENWSWVQGVLSPILEWAAFLCFGAKILLGTRYTWAELVVGGALYFIGRWTYFNSQNIWWIGIVVAVMAAKDLPLRRPLRAYLISGGAAMAVVLVLHFAGIVAPDLTSERMGLLRGTYGYGHPNTFGGLVFGLLLAYALLRAGRVRWADCAAAAAVGIFLMVGPASRTAALCSLALAVGLAVCRLRAGRPVPRLWPAGCAAFAVAEAALSYLLPLLVIKVGPWNNDIGPAWLARLDSLLTCRISLTWMAYRLLDVRIAGQAFDWPTVDNSFAFALFQFGPVVAALLLVLMAAALWGLARSGRRVEVCCLLILLLYAYMECQPFHLTTNPTALLLCGAFFAQRPEQWPRVE
ncbi:MAG: hypothetical protein U0L91_12350 [Gemmiger sp.]|uniref:hypothetical protein n=1 Tax=Gemmiger sp. TaxID=2049027 RepID=UPI002E78CE85|nr:hypothetical protein [Gemmiger sp.]MEE0802040.1 hypothetical protein [Gemmiger sp.]